MYDTSSSFECDDLDDVIGRIGDKWTVIVVGHLSRGTIRFNALLRAIPGISHRMLTQTLRNLERDGLARRTVEPSTPPKVEYELTDLGLSLTIPLALLAAWASEKRADIHLSRHNYDSISAAPAAL
jgi:DNA-binding HxlR family transcriptional regulator